MYRFNVRVYGILIEEGKVLLSDEEAHGVRFSKFPGGGLEYGEGLIDGLKREFIEECQAEIGIIRHIYTTDFFIRSAFNDSQVLSVYYLVHSINPLELNFKENSYDFDGDLLQAFRWRNLEDLHPGDVTFPSDKRVVELILNEFKP